jgi:hypothetical protein
MILTITTFVLFHTVFFLSASKLNKAETTQP